VLAPSPFQVKVGAFRGRAAERETHGAKYKSKEPSRPGRRGELALKGGKKGGGEKVAKDVDALRKEEKGAFSAEQTENLICSARITNVSLRLSRKSEMSSPLQKESMRIAQFWPPA